jgi:hypothetical protein
MNPGYPSPASTMRNDEGILPSLIRLELVKWNPETECYALTIKGFWERQTILHLEYD